MQHNSHHQIKIVFAGEDPEMQAGAVDLLARCFDVWAVRRIEYNRRFPFREISFVAMKENHIVGHAGIIPFEVQSGNGTPLKMAGIASVAVAPEERNQGIAGMLCHHAESWAREHGFDAMPLYTEKIPVYAKYGWQQYFPAAATFTAPYTAGPAGNLWKSGAQLTHQDKALIKRCYLELPELPGRVIRVDDGRSALSWSYLFAKPAGSWCILPDGYLLVMDNILAEYGGDVSPETFKAAAVTEAFLSPQDPMCAALKAANWQVKFHTADIPSCWDGEVVMMKQLSSRTPDRKLFFPLAHKF